MNQKTTYFIVLAVVLAAAAVWWAQPRPQAASLDEPRPGEPRALLEPTPGEITALEIASPGGTTMIFLREGDKWRIAAPVKAPATRFAVEAAANRFRDLKYVQAFRANDPHRPSAGLTGLDHPTRIKLTDADGNAHVLRIGGQVPAARQTYVQKEGDETIYVTTADFKQDLERSLNDFRDKRVSEFPIEEAVRIEVTGEEHYVLARSGDRWTIEAPSRGRADKTAVDAMLRSINSLNATSFVDDAPKNLAAFGLEPPAIRVVVHCEKKTTRPLPETPETKEGDEEPSEPEVEITPYTVALAFGANLEDKRFARLGGEETPWVFQVFDSVVKNAARPLINLRDKSLTQVDVRRAGRIAVSGEVGAFELMKQDGRWRLTDTGHGIVAQIGSDEAEFAAVDDLLKSVAELKATGFEDAADALRDYGFSSPRAAIEITAEGTLEPVRLTIGGTTPSGTGVYIRNEGEGFVAVVKSDDVEPLLVEPLNFVDRNMLRFDRGRVRRLEIDRDEQTLVMESVDGRWRITSPTAGDAETAAVNDVLTDLATLRARRVVGVASQLSGFGLAPPRVTARVALAPLPTPPKPAPTTQPAEDDTEAETSEADTHAEPAAPEEVHTVIASRHDGAAYAHVVGSAKVCEVDGRVLDNLTAEMLNRRITEVETSQITELTITRPDHPSFTFQKRGDDWMLVGEPSFACDATRIEDTLRMFSELRTTRYIRYQTDDLHAWGLDAPAVSLRFTTETSDVHELRIAASGPDDDGAHRYATLLGSGRVFLVAQGDLTKFDREVRDFAKQ